MPQIPTFDQVLELDPYADLRVPPEWIDKNEHMNIRHYIDIAATASMNFLESLGFDQTYRDQHRRSLFTVEQHLTYLGEMRVGERLTAHVRPVKLGAKGVHLAVMVLDRERNKPAMIFETVLLHVDMDARKALPFPAEVRHAIQPAFDRAANLTWPAPTCGALGVK